ncbi:MAG: AraC family transcriptional regulator [Bacteroidia bacterium]|nr:AraC family transcriptional regulator [Bacteroidia bacterium]
MHNEACFFHVMAGSSLSQSAVETFSLSSKESVLMKCGTYISKMHYPKTNDEFEAFAVHFHPEVLKKIYSNDLPSFLKNPSQQNDLAITKVNSTILIEKYIQSFLFYFEHPELVTEDLLILKLKELILLLYKTNDAPNIHKVLSSLFSPTSYSLKQIIESHIYSDISTSDLAQLCHMSLSSFKREFKKTFNSSPAAFIRYKKLERSKELLMISDERIGDIAFQCGFNDIAHFSKLFHLEFKQSPSEYRLNRMNKPLN